MNIQQELKTALQAVRYANRVVMEYYRKNLNIREKEDESPVTEADINSEKTIIEHLNEFDHGIVAEETGITSSKSGLFWVVDPLDGTKDFIQRTGEFCVMIGLLKEDRPLLGVVSAPVLGKIWYAVRNSGAFLIEDEHEQPISVSRRRSTENFRMVVSRNHFKQEYKAIADKLKISAIQKIGSVGIKCCTIAEGEADLCIYNTDSLGLWDCCAPHAIVTQAGGVATDLAGNPLRYDLQSQKMAHGFLVSGDSDHNTVLGTVENYTRGKND